MKITSQDIRNITSPSFEGEVYVNSAARGRCHVPFPCIAVSARCCLSRMLAIAILPTAVALNGCFSASLATGERGVDTSSLRVGATRVEAEALLGEQTKTIGEWKSAEGVSFALYAYDGGRPAHPFRGALWVPLAVYNEVLGLPFALTSGDPCVVYGPRGRRFCEAALKERKYHVMVVGYNEAGKVREIVPEEDLLRRFPDQAEGLQRTLEHIEATLGSPPPWRREAW